MLRLTLFLLVSILLSACGSKIKDMSCLERCEHRYNITQDHLNTNTHIDHTERRVDGWEADKKRADCRKKCRS